MKSTSYSTLVRPLLEYACMVWDQHTAQNIQKLEAVQRRSARFVMNNYQQTSSLTSMLQTLQWPTLTERRARIKATIVNSLVDVPPTELHTSATTARGHTARFIDLYAIAPLYRHSFFPDTIRIWNGLPQPLLESTSLETFEQGVLSCTYVFAPLLSQPAWASEIFLYPETCSSLEEEFDKSSLTTTRTNVNQ